MAVTDFQYKFRVGNLLGANGKQQSIVAVHVDGPKSHSLVHENRLEYPKHHYP
jgi:hypothetical protein